MLLTKDELAKKLRITTRTIDRWRSAGIDLGEVKLGPSVVRFDPEQIDRIIKLGKTKKRKKS